MEPKLFDDYNWKVIRSRKKKGEKPIAKVRVGNKIYSVIYAEE